MQKVERSRAGPQLCVALSKLEHERTVCMPCISKGRRAPLQRLVPEPLRARRTRSSATPQADAPRIHTSSSTPIIGETSLPGTCGGGLSTISGRLAGAAPDSPARSSFGLTLTAASAVLLRKLAAVLLSSPPARQ